MKLLKTLISFAAIAGTTLAAPASTSISTSTTKTSTSTRTSSPTTTPTALNPYAGTWNLTALTLTYTNGTVTYPIGANPFGRLVLTPGGYLVTQINSGDYVSHPLTNPQLYVPGSAADNAEVVANSFAISANYRVDTHGNYTGLTTTGCTIPNYIAVTEGPPDSTFTLSQGGQKLVESLNVGTGVVDFYWSRLEVL